MRILKIADKTLFVKLNQSRIPLLEPAREIPIWTQPDCLGKPVVVTFVIITRLNKLSSGKSRTPIPYPQSLFPLQPLLSHFSSHLGELDY